MAITRDAILGSNHFNSAGSSTVAITTTAAAAAGTRIILASSWFDSVAHTLTASDGTTYTQDGLVTNGSDKLAIFSRVAAGGLASGSTITFTMSAGFSGGFLCGAVSYLGITAVDTTSNNTTTGTSFSSGAATNSLADALFFGAIGNETATTSVGGTNTNGTSLVDIWDSGAQQGLRIMELIAASIGSQALTGTFASSSTATTGGLVIYKGTASAASATTFVPSRMPIGV